MNVLRKSFSKNVGEFYQNEDFKAQREWASPCPGGGLMNGMWVLRCGDFLVDYDPKLKTLAKRNNLQVEHGVPE